MRRLTPYLLGLLAVVLLGAAFWWAIRESTPAPASPPAPRLAPLAAPSGPSAVPLLAAILAGIAGGTLAGWLTGRGPSRHVDNLSARVARLEKELRSGAAQRHDQAARILSSVTTPERGGRPSSGRDSWFDGDPDPLPAARAEPVRPRPAQEPRSTWTPPDAEPAPPSEPIEEITARFGRVAAGQISRSGFSRFFEELGPSGGVRAERGGTTIAPASGGEELLASVNSAGRILVFPSYEFVSNQPTQFATIASVPDEVASVFELTRGDGELVVLRPAVFEEADGETRRLMKGELGGFAG